MLLIFNGTWTVSTEFWKILEYLISRKFVQWEQSSSMRTGRHTDTIFATSRKCLKIFRTNLYRLRKVTCYVQYIFSSSLALLKLIKQNTKNGASCEQLFHIMLFASVVPQPSTKSVCLLNCMRWSRCIPRGQARGSKQFFSQLETRLTSKQWGQN
jgi:hypothetical protein